MPIYLGAAMLVDIAHVEGLSSMLESAGITAPTVTEEGSVAGLDSGSSYASAATNIDVVTAQTVTALSFHSPLGGTYTVQFNGATVGSSVTVAAGSLGTFTDLKLNFSVGKHTLTLVPSVATMIRYFSGASISYKGGAFTASGWTGVGTSFTIPYRYTCSTVTAKRLTATYTSASLAANGQEVGVVALYPSYRLIKISASRQCRVRLYDTLAHRTSDLTRPRTTAIDESTDHGLMLDVALQTGNLARTLTPLVDGANFETGNNVAITVDNLDTVAGTVAVTFTYIRAE